MPHIRFRRLVTTGQKRHEPVLQWNGLATYRLALPNDKHLPPQTPQQSSRAPIPPSVPVEFRDPVAAPRSGNATPSTSVHVPKTAVNNDDLPQTRKDQVWHSR